MPQHHRRTITTGAACRAFLAGRKSLNVSGSINMAIERYMLVCAAHLPMLTWREWLAIFEALNGVWSLEGWSPHYVAMEVQYSSWLGHKWQIDQAALVAKMQRWDYATCVAVADAAERFWAGDPTPGNEGQAPSVAAIVGPSHCLEA